MSSNRVIGILKKFINTLAILIIAEIAGFALLLGAFMIPGQYAQENVGKSINTIKEQGRYPNLVPWTFSMLDTYTDSVMLLSAMYEGDERLQDKALMDYKYENINMEPEFSIVSYFEDGKQDMEVTSYAKYWHGYIVFLRPLLSFMTYDAIRIVNTIVQILLCGWIVWLLYKKSLKKFIVPFVLSVVTLTPIAIGWCLQFSAVYYITLIGCIIILLNSDRWKDTDKYIYFFLITGICTSYLDLLTFPLVTYGIPMVMAILTDKNDSVSKTWKKCIQYLIYWGIGYVGMWAMKWGISSIAASGFNMGDVIYSLLYRSAGSTDEGIKCSYIMVLIRNAGVFALNPVIIIIFAYIVLNVKKIYKNKSMKIFWNYVKMYAVPLLLPLVWYLGTRNHSYIHCEFTYREWAMTAFAGLFALTCTLVDINPENEKDKYVALEKDKTNG